MIDFSDDAERVSNPNRTGSKQAPEDETLGAESLNLDATQRRVLLRVVVGGESVKDATTAEGVHRCTFYKWRKDPEFQAAVNRLQHDQDDEFTLLRRAMAQAAGESVMKAIASDPRLGLQVLDRVGFFAPQLPSPGSENPDHLRTMAGLKKATTAQAEHRAVMSEVGHIAAEEETGILEMAQLGREGTPDKSKAREEVRRQRAELLTRLGEIFNSAGQTSAPASERNQDQGSGGEEPAPTGAGARTSHDAETPSHPEQQSP
jgi:hypothetical protein